MESMSPVEAFYRLRERGIMTSGQIKSFECGSEYYPPEVVEEMLQLGRIVLPNLFSSSEPATSQS